MTTIPMARPPERVDLDTQANATFLSDDDDDDDGIMRAGILDEWPAIWNCVTNSPVSLRASQSEHTAHR